MKRKRKSIADMFREEGALIAARRILLELLRDHFGDVPAETTAGIENCTDKAKLDAWLDAVFTVLTLIKVGTPPIRGC